MFLSYKVQFFYFFHQVQCNKLDESFLPPNRYKAIILLESSNALRIIPHCYVFLPWWKLIPCCKLYYKSRHKLHEQILNNIKILFLFFLAMGLFLIAIGLYLIFKNFILFYLVD